MLLRLLENHVLANLLFVLIIIVGVHAYLNLPRQQDPTINFNWIDITTIFPGATASDVETRVTDVLEEAIRNIGDIKFVSSNSREGVSNILVRFQEISDRNFDKRITDLRREIQNKIDELPDEVEDPFIFEVTSANAFPVATVAVTAPSDSEHLRLQAEIAKKDIERLAGVDRILEIALPQPELQVLFDPTSLTRHNLSPVDLADTVASYYRDISAGSVDVDGENWLVRLTGTNPQAQYLADLPVITANGEVPLGAVAEVSRGREKSKQLVRFNGDPAVLLAVNKKGDANILRVVDRVREYVERRNSELQNSASRLILIDDQTEITKSAISVMQTNALLGLALVLLVTWLFLGSRIALLTCIGIPFILAGTFWLLKEMGQTLNTSVLLGVVISLGMLVDDAVVVVEAIYYRLERGMEVAKATLAALKEVFSPVTTSVLTTVSVFGALTLVPGILGQFMLVIPLVVCTALLVSLIEAYWMLPAHMIAAKVSFSRPSRIHAYRVRVLHWIRLKYSKALIKVMRRPIISVVGIASFSAVAVLLAMLTFKFDFFASDPLRLFYINVVMPTGTPLEKTMDTVLEIEHRTKQIVQKKETRAIVSYAGQMFTETAPFFGDHYGQVLVSLNPSEQDLRSVDDIVEDLRSHVESVAGPNELNFFVLKGGPPTTRPISVKVRGDDMQEIRSVVAQLKAALQENQNIIDISDDSPPGQLEFSLSLNSDAIRRSGLSPDLIARTLRLLVDGEVVASMQDQGEELELRVRAGEDIYRSPDVLLRFSLTNQAGELVPLDTLVEVKRERGPANIRHYNFRRAITLEADVVENTINTVQANDYLLSHWEKIKVNHPNIDLDFTGELDDLTESLNSLQLLFLLGLALMYLILGTQFNSYFQPFMIILVTLPTALVGVTLGTYISQQPVTLVTMYGVVALTGIAVNSAIVLVSASNDRLRSGMSLTHAAIFAARRRVIPIMITSLTTIAGLFSLATGLGGQSLFWGPVATSIVWGLSFSSAMTLFLIPLLYRLFMVNSKLTKR